MSTATAAGLLLIVVPIAFNVAFALLASRFDYPDILRRPTEDILTRFRDGGVGLVLLWWGFALTAVLLAPLVVLTSQSLDGADAGLLAVATVVGVLASVVQFLGLIRWPFVVPYLARVSVESDVTAARREAVDIVFQSLNRYLGVAVGEHLGYGLTGGWTLLTGVAVTQSTTVPGWLGIVGVVIGPTLMLCSLEFVGPFERTGWKLAGQLTPIAYIAWSLWLLATGVALLA